MKFKIHIVSTSHAFLPKVAASYMMWESYIERRLFEVVFYRLIAFDARGFVFSEESIYLAKMV